MDRLHSEILGFAGRLRVGIVRVPRVLPALVLLGALTLAARSNLIRLDSPEASRLETIRSAGHRLEPLHRKKRPPQPGEWLASHQEVGQTFDAYLAEAPDRGPDLRTTLYLQPIGTVDADQSKLLRQTGEMLRRFYDVEVRFLDPIPLESVPQRARRIPPRGGAEQLLTGHLLALLKERRPADAVAVLGLTTSDLWPGEGWNFVFGQASLNERVGVWSTHRNGDPASDYTTCLRRTLKTALHETGHMFGIRHCTAYECGMNGSNHRAESDSRPMAFCPQCEMKVWWIRACEPRARYARLAELAHSLGLPEEARFWEQSRAAVLRSAPALPERTLRHSLAK
jgi:archaemetzincin